MTWYGYILPDIIADVPSSLSTQVYVIFFSFLKFWDYTYYNILSSLSFIQIQIVLPKYSGKYGLPLTSSNLKNKSPHSDNLNPSFS